jgi:hypothetical protein
MEAGSGTQSNTSVRTRQLRGVLFYVRQGYFPNEAQEKQVRACFESGAAGSTPESETDGRRDQRPSGLRELEKYLTERRKDINRRYEFPESKLSLVFGTLLHEGRITEERLRGLGEDKLKRVRSHADVLRIADEPIQVMRPR